MVSKAPKMIIMIGMTFLAAISMMTVHLMITQQHGHKERRERALAHDHRQRQEHEAKRKAQELEESTDEPATRDPHQPVPSHHIVKIQRPELPVSPPYLSLTERMGVDHGVIYRDKREDDPRKGDELMKWWTISRQNPRANYVEGFWTDEEADLIVSFAKKKIQRSTVVGGKKGDGVENSVRTSKGMFITEPEEANHPVVLASRKRVSLLTGLPESNIEATQVLRYEGGERYLAHPDYFQKIYTEHLARGGQRVATLLAWLADTPHGGNTSFPMSTGPDGKPYTVAPKKGDAIVFWDCTQDIGADGYCEGDPYSTHEAHPPTDGSEKWVSVFWVRQRTFI